MVLLHSFLQFLGAKVGSHIQFGLKSKIDDGNVISIQNIPDGTTSM